MTNASHNVFVDRRTAEQRAGELATQVLFWYDKDGKGNKRRRRTNGMAMTTDGFLVVARATCSRKDQFVKTHGRMVVEKRILGRAQRHCVTLYVNERDLDLAEAAAAAYSEAFPGDETGFKRAFNTGKIFVSYQADIEKRANELDES
jgi:hypothetical protein